MKEPCANCGKDFTVTRKHQIYCKDKCRREAYEKSHLSFTATEVDEILRFMASINNIISIARARKAGKKTRQS